MKLNFILAVLLVAMLVSDTDAWRRRRRRRRACHRQNCLKGWSAWTPCTCMGVSSRHEKVTRFQTCGGAACALRTEHRKCYNR